MIQTKASQSCTTTLPFDMIAGLTAAAVVLPKAMAYATVAGLPLRSVCIPHGGLGNADE